MLNYFISPFNFNFDKPVCEVIDYFQKNIVQIYVKGAIFLKLRKVLRMKSAFVFPGQGSQYVGMGSTLANNFPKARLVFEEVDEALGESLSKLIWEGDISNLTLTRNAQPALMATSIAALKALESEGFSVSDLSYMAGHSLGEYSALCAAGALTLYDCSKLLRSRGDAMQSAVQVGEGAMVAIIGLSSDQVNELIKEVNPAGICEVANDNEPSQVVISGNKKTVNQISEAAKERGARRALQLPVSAPFHCSLMSPAREKMSEALENVIIKVPVVPIVSNVLALPITDPISIRLRLLDQVVGMVRWRESVCFMKNNGVMRFVELGAGKVLSGLIRRITLKNEQEKIETLNVGDVTEVRKIREVFGV